ncbi:MAG: dTDP-4-dehydrorhamnose 3,5-epimerase [Prevotella sp.]|nr:dTDP-4-dehydrorhamnose 3,5-epimerase [Prevotella sp.]
MQFIETKLKGVWVIEPKVYADARGYFMETWRQDEFEAKAGPVRFVQDNESRSVRGVLRGLHYQKGEFSQAKLVRVICGAVDDVAVDLRRSSETFGGWVMVNLSGDNKRQLFIPRGFAHGFIVRSETAVFAYKTDNFYAPAAETGIRWDDADLAIDWKAGAEVISSEKDLRLPSFKEAEYFD